MVYLMGLAASNSSVDSRFDSDKAIGACRSVSDRADRWRDRANKDTPPLGDPPIRLVGGGGNTGKRTAAAYRPELFVEWVCGLTAGCEQSLSALLLL